jgi:hypothetical protein
VRGQVPGKLLLGHALTVGGYGAALRTMTDGSLGRHLSRRIDESGQSLTPPATTYSVFTADSMKALETMKYLADQFISRRVQPERAEPTGRRRRRGDVRQYLGRFPTESFS